MALIGLVMLAGIVVKNGIVLIDYTNLNRERGYSITYSVIHAGRSRLRPVLMDDPYYGNRYDTYGHRHR